MENLVVSNLTINNRRESSKTETQYQYRSTRIEEELMIWPPTPGGSYRSGAHRTLVGPSSACGGALKRGRREYRSGSERRGICHSCDVSLCHVRLFIVYFLVPWFLIKWFSNHVIFSLPLLYSINNLFFFYFPFLVLQSSISFSQTIKVCCLLFNFMHPPLFFFSFLVFYYISF